MESKKMKIEQIPSLENFNGFVNYFEKQYGNITMIEILKLINGEKTTIAKFSSVDEMKINVNATIFSQIDIFEMYFTRTIEAPKKISLDIRNKELTLTSYDLGITVGKESNEIVVPTQTLEQALSDPNCKYYRFETGRIAKYNPEDGLYYILNKKNEWEIDGSVFPWLIGAEYDYEEIMSSEKKTSRGI